MAKTNPNNVGVLPANEADMPPAKSISEVLGLDPILPGESTADYRQGLKALIGELGAKTVLQVYLAEKIYDCLWWMRRYEEQKRATVIAEMANQCKTGGFSLNLTQDQIDLREALLQNKPTQETYKIAAKSAHSMESLREVAMSHKRAQLQQLDQQIALQAKILAGLQASYEVAFNRKLNIERLRLQNEMLRRDLDTVDGEVVDGNPKAKGSQPT